MNSDLNDDVEFSRVFFILRKRVWIILGVGVCAALVAFLYSALQTPQYRATAEVSVIDQTAGLFKAGATGDPKRVVTNSIYLASSRAVQDPALASLGEDASSVSEITATAAEDTNIMQVTATADSADLARDAANAVANTFVEQSEALKIKGREDQAASLRNLAAALTDDITNLDAAILVAAGTPDADPLRLQRSRFVNQQADLLSRANQLDFDADLQAGAGAISVLVPAVSPSSPFEPTPLRDSILAGIAGIFLGIAAVLIYDWTNTRVSTPSEVSLLADGAAVVGSIPLAGSRRLRHRHLPNLKRGLVPVNSPADEAFRSLAANLRFSAVGRSSTRIVVTSPSAGEGKTTLVANLARNLAIAGSNVVVVSADMRKPSLGQVFGVDDSSDGLSTVLLGDTTLRDALQSIEVAPGIRVIVLPSGPLPGNPPALLGSAAMDALLTRLEAGGADIILLDTAPLLPVSDTLVLTQHCDSVLLTVVPESTKKAYLKEAVSRLRNVGAEILGVSLNGVTESTFEYYGYGAGAYGGELDSSALSVHAGNDEDLGSSTNGASASGANRGAGEPAQGPRTPA